MRFLQLVLSKEATEERHDNIIILLHIFHYVLQERLLRFRICACNLGLINILQVRRSSLVVLTLLGVGTVSRVVLACDVVDLLLELFVPLSEFAAQIGLVNVTNHLSRLAEELLLYASISLLD